MPFHSWILVIGTLLLAIALLHPVVSRLPITTTIVYLGVGLALGPLGTGVLSLDPLHHSSWLHHGAEIAVIVSLFTVGMKLPVMLQDAALRPAFGLATLSMVLTVGMVAAVAVPFLGLPLGAAILLGAVLAPTDPVLASDIQLRDPKDSDRVRMTLSAESGMNDGTAFPFVFLGLGLLGLHDLGTGGWRWVAVDLLWAGLGGLAIGWCYGFALGKGVMWLQRRMGVATRYGEYLVLGVIGLSYGTAVQLAAYGFLAVFAAGAAVRFAEGGARLGRERFEDERKPPPPLSTLLLKTNEQLEHLLEVGMVVMVGAALAYLSLTPSLLWFAPILFLVLRPLSCVPVLALARFSPVESAAVAWFGIRGIGSIYYVMFALDRGLPEAIGEELVSITFGVVGLSILLHGISVTPLLDAYERRRRVAR